MPRGKRARFLLSCAPGVCLNKAVKGVLATLRRVVMTNPFCPLQKPLGEQFRKDVHIRNLPSLFKKVKPSLETDVLENEDGEGLNTLFEP